MTDIIEGTHVVVPQEPVEPCELWIASWRRAGGDFWISAFYENEKDCDQDIHEERDCGSQVRKFHCTDQPKKLPTADEIAAEWRKLWWEQYAPSVWEK